MIDPTGNFIISTVNTAPDPADEGTTLTVDSADEGLFTSLIVTGAFNAVVWPFGVEPRISSAEIVRVTDITDGVFTIDRGQEGTTARNIATGWNIAVTPTSKTITDLFDSIPVDTGDLTNNAGFISEETDPVWESEKASYVISDTLSATVDYSNSQLINSSLQAVVNWSNGFAFRDTTTGNLEKIIAVAATEDRELTLPDATGTIALTSDIPADISDLTDTTGVIPADVSDLTDTTGIISDKADKSNVLELDNTTEFTPDADYEPATKKYVDDNGGTIAGVFSVSSQAELEAALEDTNYTSKNIFLTTANISITTSTVSLYGQNRVYGDINLSGASQVWTFDDSAVGVLGFAEVYFYGYFVSVDTLEIAIDEVCYMYANQVFVYPDKTVTISGTGTFDYQVDFSEGTLVGAGQYNWLSPALIDTYDLKAGVLDIDLSSVSASDDTLPSAKATKAYVDNGSATMTNKTIDGDDNTVQDLAYSSIKSTSRSGSDTTLITGTKGTSGDLAQWNADGDLVGADITVSEILQTVYPVGAIYISVVSTSPATLFGGTWSAFGAGKVLVGLDSGDTAFDTVEETGGVKEVTLTSAQSGLPAHTHTQNAHSHTSLASRVRSGTSGTLDGAGGTTFSFDIDQGTAEATATNQNNTAANASSAHTNLQPYIVVYMWKRTA